MRGAGHHGDKGLGVEASEQIGLQLEIGGAKAAGEAPPIGQVQENHGRGAQGDGRQSVAAMDQQEQPGRSEVEDAVLAGGPGESEAEPRGGGSGGALACQAIYGEGRAEEGRCMRIEGL